MWRILYNLLLFQNVIILLLTGYTYGTNAWIRYTSLNIGSLHICLLLQWTVSKKVIVVCYVKRYNFLLPFSVFIAFKNGGIIRPEKSNFISWPTKSIIRHDTNSYSPSVYVGKQLKEVDITWRGLFFIASWRSLITILTPRRYLIRWDSGRILLSPMESAGTAAWATREGGQLCPGAPAPCRGLHREASP